MRTIRLRTLAALAPVLALLPAASCARDGATRGASAAAANACPGTLLAVTDTGAKGAHRFCVEQAKTAPEQERGLMYRTNIPAEGGMLFWPYPPNDDAGRPQPPRDASFWMKNTPSALDIIFIRPDGTIARIAENAVPFDETPLASGEPVGAVLEIRGGRALELGIGPGDKMTWPGK